MNNLDFVNKLNESGICIRSTNAENVEKIISIPTPFGLPEKVIIKNLNVDYEEHSMFFRKTALQAIISKAIDMDSWKHSWHNDIVPENYEKFKEIIQDKILNRASEIDELFTVYFQLNHEIENNQNVMP